MRRLRCFLRGWFETLTMDLFWQSLMQPPLVVVDGHVYDYPDGHQCVECGAADGLR